MTTDLGDGHVLTWLSWAPDDLPANRRLFGIVDGEPMPHLEKVGASITHRAADGRECCGTVHFDTPDVQKFHLAGPNHRWRVVSWEPLTVEPSIRCGLCGDHGFISAGKWVRV